MPSVFRVFGEKGLGHLRIILSHRHVQKSISLAVVALSEKVFQEVIHEDAHKTTIF